MIGTWKRIDNPMGNSMKIAFENGVGNMTLRADSTIFIQGAPGSDTTTVGWHVGSFSGKWSMISPHVMLGRFDPNDSNMALPLRIKKLTRTKLYLQSGGKTDGRLMKYKRIAQ